MLRWRGQPGVHGAHPPRVQRWPESQREDEGGPRGAMVEASLLPSRCLPSASALQWPQRRVPQPLEGLPVPPGPLPGAPGSAGHPHVPAARTGIREEISLLTRHDRCPRDGHDELGQHVVGPGLTEDVDSSDGQAQMQAF